MGTSHAYFDLTKVIAHVQVQLASITLGEGSSRDVDVLVMAARNLLIIVDGIEGRTIEEIANLHGLSPGRVSDIMRGLS